MGERTERSYNVHRLTEKVGAIMLSAALALEPSHSAPAYSFYTEHESSLTKKMPTFSYRELQRDLKDNLASAVLDLDTNTYRIIKNTLPPKYADEFQSSINQPLMRLSAQEALIPAVTVSEVNSIGHFKSTYENGYFINETDVINLDISTKTKSAGQIYQDPSRMTGIVGHEVMHGFDEEWYAAIANRRDGSEQDPLFFSKAKRLVNACYSLNKDILEQYMKSNSEQLIGTLESAAKGIDNTNSLVSSIMRLGQGKAITIGTVAIRDNSPRIYTTPQLFYPTCSLPDLQAILANVTSLGTDSNFSYYFETTPLKQMQQKLFATATNAYRCVNEGTGIAARTGDWTAAALGHSQENMTEMASSTISSLLANPDYIVQCLGNIYTRRSAMLRDYIDATLDMIIHMNPEIEGILRQQQDTSRVLDQLWHPTT